MRSQKNDQEAKGQFILIEPTWSVSCPCRLLVEYLQEFGFMIGQSIQGDKPLFVSLNDNVSPISSGAVNSAVKRVAKILGLGSNITGHSLRFQWWLYSRCSSWHSDGDYTGHRGVVQRRNVELHSRIGCSCVVRDSAYGSLRVLCCGIL